MRRGHPGGRRVGRRAQKGQGWGLGHLGEGGEEQHSGLSHYCFFFFFKNIQMFFLLKLDGFTFTAGVDAGKMHLFFTVAQRKILPLNERSPSRSSSSPPAEAGLVGKVVWITGTTSLPPRRSNKSLAWGRRTACEQDNKQTKKLQQRNLFLVRAHKKCNRTIALPFKVYILNQVLRNALT